ncbi:MULTISPECIES: cell filamentation protein Fic [Actinomyces]|uniref:Cell filamentation protein Fic n=1 Tax=Actinomyces respiraculi TaxID=2744574 RepID=A0A7T0LK82_9ACTO|nr:MULTISPECIES: cell filamentation protein Fic [Actinomyces]QPL05324.1 cell filamentation protein Fic [Actinomyces respiraculi]
MSTDPAVAALRAVAAHPRVREAEAAVREASTALRWSEALRRRWREARVEAAVRGAVASAGVEGAVVPARLLREAVAERTLTEALTGDPALDAAAGLWRAGVRLTRWWPDLRGPLRPAQPTPRELLAALHRDVVGPLAAAGTIPVADVAVPRPAGTAPLEGGPGPTPDGPALTARLDGILHLVDVPGAPALVRAAVVHAETVAARPFTAGNAAVARLLARHLVTRDGLEPTGVAVADLWAARDPGGYAQALAAYASGTGDGVVDWVVWQAQALLVGIEEGLSLCRDIQAGTTAAGAQGRS